MMFTSRIKELVKNTNLYNLYLKRKYQKNAYAEFRFNKVKRGPIIDQFIPKGGIGAELGVLKGNFSRVLIEITQAKKLHLIDPWYFLDSHWHWAGDNTSTVDAVCKVLQENKKDIEEKRVFGHIKDDIEVLNTFPDYYFDWVYIDSSHAYKHTVEELILLKDKVKSNGVIGGDVWRPDPEHRHHGVYKAVNEFMKKYKYKLLYADEDNLQWFIKKDTIK